MRIDVLTLFPEMFDLFHSSIMGKAQEKGLFQLHIHNIRDHSTHRHKSVDDYPYGGGAGMVMTPQPIFDAVAELRKVNDGPVIYLGPKGDTFNQEKAKELSHLDAAIFLCGHYEGIDERIYECIDMEISLGDFILTGGEMAAIPILDSILRLKDGVLGKGESVLEESFSESLLEYPQYTRPEEFRGRKVPSVLLSGHHENIRKWRRYRMLKETQEKRPDLYLRHVLTKEDRKILQKFASEEEKE